MDSKIPNKVQSILYALENEVQKITTVEAMKNIRDAFTVIASNFEAAIKGLEAQITSKKNNPSGMLKKWRTILWLQRSQFIVGFTSKMKIKN